ncbi:Polyadenylate-binding protein-interacting protein 4 [Camellia lanceoleosa]|uniref:Polyadenylate-binding protein-interacting protein 4 n=1 Tax=Camellia lanceoleosa TaxID=1840588 RepID=A0ACC0HII8_9ERIC|nr:Polyadenylate-binding protein-interacting protein 4 [Camellia lanceoleosa]
MGYRNRELHGQEIAVPASFSDALLFTTMCIIGLPVDVHVKDGSVYSGIFHTACVENDYGIVLKKARMIKKGNCDANVVSGDLIETLVVISEDLVQVVAKGISLPTDGVACNVAGDDAGGVVGTISTLECADRGVKMKKPNKINMERIQTSRTRRPPQVENRIAYGFAPTAVCHVGNAPIVENGKSDGIDSNKEASSAQVNGRQVVDGRSQGKQFDFEGKSDFQKEETKSEVQGSGSSLDACFSQSKAVEEVHQDIASKQLPNGGPSDRPASSIVKLKDQNQERHTSEDSSYSNASSVSTSGTLFVEAITESCVSSSTPTEMVLPKNSSLTSKEFKLNPGAKVFCPSFASHRSVTPPAMPTTVANVSYIPDNFPVVPIASALPEVDMSSFVPRSSLPVKFVPHGNLIAGNGINDSQYSQPIIEHVGSRTQPARYAGHHHSIQAGPAYMHSNSQNVMVGRLGQLIYMHPVSHGVNQGVAAFSQVSTHPLLNTHQGHLPKHQGSAGAQALQLCLTPPFIASGQQQPFAVQSNIPLPVPQPPFPVIRPIPVPGSTGIFNTKFP